MLAIILSWIIILFTLLSFGYMFIALYQKVCKQNEYYNILDIFLLGMCSLTVLLAITSIWIPSNQYVLFILLIISTLYWVSNKSELYNLKQSIKKFFVNLSKSNRVFLFISVLSIIFYMCWAAHWFDATFYHYQNIRWDEEYSVVPGLGNLEHRFGFNSNYFLLSAVFSLRFIFGEAIYAGLQSVFTILIICWILIELVRSNFELKRILLLLFFLVLFTYNVDGMTDSSTDFIPNYCVFYLISRFILYPNIFRDSKLLYYILPITLITFKLSAGTFGIIGIAILIYLIKRKNYQILSSYLIIAFIVIIPWIVRNVIVSGYLFFPLSALDIFSVDWKIPKSIALAESANVSGFAKLTFDNFITFQYFKSFGFMNNKILFITILIMNVSCFLALISPVIIGYKYYKDRTLNKNYILIYLSLMIYLIYWYILAPDPRFANGAYLGLDFLLISLLLSNNIKKYPKFGKLLIPIFALTLLLTSFKRTYNYYKLLYPTSIKEGRVSLKTIFYKPYSSKSQSEARRVPQGEFTIYKLGDLDIYITPDWNRGATYDMLPSTSLEALRIPLKYQPLKTIEARGTTLQEGFRPKKEYKN